MKSNKWGNGPSSHYHFVRFSVPPSTPISTLSLRFFEPLHLSLTSARLDLCNVHYKNCTGCHFVKMDVFWKAKRQRFLCSVQMQPFSVCTHISKECGLIDLKLRFNTAIQKHPVRVREGVQNVPWLKVAMKQISQKQMLFYTWNPISLYAFKASKGSHGKYKAKTPFFRLVSHLHFSFPLSHKRAHRQSTKSQCCCVLRLFADETSIKAMFYIEMRSKRKDNAKWLTPYFWYMCAKLDQD